MKKLIAVVFSILISTAAWASVPGQPVAKPLREQVIELTKKYSKEFNVDPAFALAVLHIESRLGSREFRTGPMGRGTFYGPGGVHKCFLRRGWPIDTLEGNVMVSVRALRNTGSDRAAQERRLRRYNASCTGAYIAAVMRAKEKYREEVK